jgi:hypothetical protein
MRGHRRRQGAAPAWENRRRGRISACTSPGKRKKSGAAPAHRYAGGGFHKTVKGRSRLAFWRIVALQLAVRVWVIFAWQSGHGR